jgi:hypothetical protein
MGAPHHQSVCVSVGLGPQQVRGVNGIEMGDEAPKLLSDQLIV